MAPLANQLWSAATRATRLLRDPGPVRRGHAILNGVGGHPLAQIASNSWEGTESQPLNLINIEHAYLVRAAAEGVSMLFSAGDGSGVLTPSSDPYATAVGGTTLGIGKKVPRLFETGWSTGISRRQQPWIFAGRGDASGGGPSLLWASRATSAAWCRARLPRRRATGRAGPRPARHQRGRATRSTGMEVGMLTFNSKGT